MHEIEEFSFFVAAALFLQAQSGITGRVPIATFC
jgi:hypothetical protein